MGRHEGVSAHFTVSELGTSFFLEENILFFATSLPIHRLLLLNSCHAEFLCANILDFGLRK